MFWTQNKHSRLPEAYHLLPDQTRVVHLQKMTGLAGSEYFLTNLGRSLSERGWDCRFGLIEEENNPVDDAYEKLRKAGWSVERFPYRKGLLLTLLPGINQWLNSIDPELVHTHLIHGDLLGAIASYWIDAKFITSKHNDDRFKHFPGYGIFARLLNQTFDQGIAISNHLKTFYEDRLGVGKPEFETIHYGLNVEEFSEDTHRSAESDTSFTYGIVARLTEQKGHSTLLEAFGEVIESSDNENVKLQIVGDGPLRDDLEAKTRSLGLSDRVTFEGYRSDVKRVMKGFDVFVHPSRWEGFGRVLLEAMASKLPIIATDVSAIPEIVLHNKTGMLVPPDDTRKLADAMLDLKHNEKSRRQLANAGYKRINEKFTIDKMVQKHEDIYKKLISD